MSNSPPLPERKRIVDTVACTHRGHRLARIAERLPGSEPTDAAIALGDGPTYETRYWRCLACGQERNHRSELRSECLAAVALAADGGYSVEDGRTREALSEGMAIRVDGSGYAVQSASGVTHRVDLVGETCTCEDHRGRGIYCKHLRRVDIEVRAGTLPDVGT